MALSPVAWRKFSELYETQGQKDVLDKETDHLLVPILKDIKYGIRENIMDHGCGTGRIGMKYFVPAAERTDSKIYAIDNSETMIEHAKEFYPHPRVTYYKTDLLAHDFPLNDVKFHKIFSIHVFALLDCWRITLKKMFDLLKPRGVLTVMIVVNSTDFFQVHKHIKQHPKWQSHPHGKDIVVPDWFDDEMDTEDNFENVLKSIGFNVLSIDTHQRTHVFPSKEAAIELYMAGYPSLHEKNLKTPEDRHEFHQTAVEFLHSRENGTGKNLSVSKEYPITYETLVFYAQKPDLPVAAAPSN